MIFRTVRSKEIALEREALAYDEFDRAACLFRVSVIPAENQVTLMVAADHSIFDARSMLVLASDLACEYYALRDTNSPSTRPSPAQFYEYCERLADPPQDSCDYWRDRLRAAPLLLEFPKERSPKELERQSLRVVHVLSTQLVEKAEAYVKKLALGKARRRPTLFKLLLAVQAFLLRRYSGQDSVVIGVPVSRRDAVPGTAFTDSIGMFVNTLPILVEMGLLLESPFADLVHQILQSFDDAEKHASVPLDKISRLPPQYPSTERIIASSRFSSIMLSSLAICGAREISSSVRAQPCLPASFLS
eukprot:594755-Amphidinium_carterae.1